MPDELTPQQAAIRGKIDSILASDSYRNPLSLDHEATQQRIQSLYSALYDAPTEQVEGASEVEARKIDNPEQADAALRPLKEEWSSSYESNVQAAQGLVEHLTREMGLEVVELFDDIGSHPTVIKACFEWSQGRDGGDLSPDQAKEVIALIQKSRVYQSGISQASEVLRNVMAVLYEAAYQQES